ncbi:MAG TPA: 50S ribosomal protein L18 [Candidatus Thermoplasmatota archaeon]|nr:50S ribosomal protein L18 [Candidatus Thermoplasmatota archaeon]
MADGPRYHVAMRRRRENRTDYRRRLALLKARKPRLVVRKKTANLIVQLVGYDAQGDVVLAQAQARELSGFGWTGAAKNTPAAYLVGYLAGRRAAATGVKEAVLDIGRQIPSKGGRIFAALQGVLDAGIDVPHGNDVLPDAARVKGEHIDDLAEGVFAATKAKIESGKPNSKPATTGGASR